MLKYWWENSGFCFPDHIIRTISSQMNYTPNVLCLTFGVQFSLAHCGTLFYLTDITDSLVPFRTGRMLRALLRPRLLQYRPEASQKRMWWQWGRPSWSGYGIGMRSVPRRRSFLSDGMLSGSLRKVSRRWKVCLHPRFEGRWQHHCMQRNRMSLKYRVLWLWIGCLGMDSRQWGKE